MSAILFVLEMNLIIKISEKKAYGPTTSSGMKLAPTSLRYKQDDMDHVIIGRHCIKGKDNTSSQISQDTRLSKRDQLIQIELSPNKMHVQVVWRHIEGKRSNRFYKGTGGPGIKEDRAAIAPGQDQRVGLPEWPTPETDLITHILDPNNYSRGSIKKPLDWLEVPPKLYRLVPVYNIWKATFAYVIIGRGIKGDQGNTPQTPKYSPSVI